MAPAKAQIVCKECGAVLNSDYVIPGLDSDNHTSLTSKVTKVATYKEDGVRTHKCEACGYYKAEAIPKLECSHARVDFYKVREANCVAKAKGMLLCLDCGKVLDSNYEKGEVNSSRHLHMTEEVITERSYREDGVTKYTCEDCGYTYTEVRPKAECDHTWDGKVKVSTTEVVVKMPTSTECGYTDSICDRCGKSVLGDNLEDKHPIHPCNTYTLVDGKGVTHTIYGWFDYEAAKEVWRLTNEYRVENGLNELVYNDSLQWASDIRGYEESVDFAHSRPASSDMWTTVCSQWTYGAENLVGLVESPEHAIDAWKNSPGHNRNMLYNGLKGLSVGYFHRYTFDDEENPTYYHDTIWVVQNFTFYEYK